jgi:hypothetical protein
MLREIVDEIRKMADPQLVVRIKQRDLSLLMLMLPDELQLPIDAMRRTLSLLLQKQPEKFKEKYAIAEGDFYDALDRRQKIEAYVSKIERSVVPPSYLYAPQLLEVDRYNKMKGSLWPKLQSFMNKTEKKIAQ